MTELVSQTLAGLAPRRVPEAYVRAEVAAFPLTSETAFSQAMIGLAPSLDGPDDATRALWRECEKSLSEHASGWSLDRLIAIRDYFWFPDRATGVHGAPGATPMHRYLRHLAERHLARHPTVTEIAQSVTTNPFDAVTHYRWLTFALPEDLLLVGTGVEPWPVHVDLEPPLLVRRLLDQGVAEIHHHVNAGMSFPLLWVSLLAVLADPALERDALRGPALPLGGGETLLRWLLAAAVTRCVLAELLVRASDSSLFDFVRGLRDAPAWRPQRWRVLERALVALGEGREDALPGFYELRSLYGDLHPEGRAIATMGRRPRTLDAVWKRCDPIAARLGLSTPDAGEHWLVRHGLERLERQERGSGSDEPFERLFWQVLRVRCLWYRSVVQRPMTAGLQWFIRFEGRLGTLRRPLWAVRAEASYRVAADGQPIAALEVRTTPKDTPFELAEELHELTSSWRQVLKKTGGRAGDRETEFGLVLHFAKERDPDRNWQGGNPPAYGTGTHAEPRPRNVVRLGGRYTDYFVGQAAKARATVELLEAVPLALWLVRGLDVASDELSVPTWVLVPLYQYVERNAAKVAAKRSAEGAPPLRLTAHVGEDFRHLMEGLRRIQECIQYLLPRTGGRLGHATALGFEPRLWAESVGSVMMPAEERLWDLVFEWRLYSHYRIPDELRAAAAPGRIPQVENQIRQLSEQVFCRSLEPNVLAEVHHVLHEQWRPPMAPEDVPPSLDGFNLALNWVDPADVRCRQQVYPLLHRYRDDEKVFRQGQELVDIMLDGSEVAALEAVQDALRRCVGARGIVVEVNPSSNLLIGNLLDLRHHPVLRLFPPEPQAGAPPPVPIAIGADDPITFSTCLLREYSLLFEAARAAGYSERVVHDWLNAIRRNGMDARFTVPWKPSPTKMATRLLRELDRYLQRPRRHRAV